MQGIRSLHPTRPAGLLGVPLEIRQQIYRYFLVRRVPIELDFLNFHPYQWSDEFCKWLDVERNTAVLLVSRQLSEEALDVLYGENVFKVVLHGGRPNILSQFAPANRQRIRRLQLVLRPMGVSYGSPLNLDSQIWPPILANLAKLCIVAQQPLEPRHYYNAPSLEQDMDEWLTWLKPVLEYVNQYVSSGTVVEVDDDDREETSELVKECLPNGYRKVQTRTGDLCFMRGEFSWESGYWDDDYTPNFADTWGEDWYSD